MRFELCETHLFVFENNAIFAAPFWAKHGCSSIGRVVVSKTIGWEFESLHPCEMLKRTDE